MDRGSACPSARGRELDSCTSPRRGRERGSDSRTWLGKKTRWQTHRIQIQVRLGDGIATWTGGDVPAGCTLGHSHCPVRNANVQCLDGRSLDGVLGAMTRRELSLLSLLTFLPCSGSIRSFHQPGRIQPVNECWKCESTLSRTLCHICSLLYIRSRHINTRLGSDIIDRRPSGPRVSPPAPRSRPKTFRLARTTDFGFVFSLFAVCSTALFPLISLSKNLFSSSFIYSFIVIQHPSLWCCFVRYVHLSPSIPLAG